jgi:hypothetical protein
MSLTRIIDSFGSVWLIFWFSFFAVYIHFGGRAFAGLVLYLGPVAWLVWGAKRDKVPIISRDLIVCGVAFGLLFLWLGISEQWNALGIDRNYDKAGETAYRLAGEMALIAALPAYILTRTAWRRTVLSQILMSMALAGVAVMALDVWSGYGINTYIYPDGAETDLNLRQGVAEMDIGRGHVIYAVIMPLFLAFFATLLPRRWRWPAALYFVATIVIGTMLNRLAIVPVIMLAAAPLFYLGYKSPLWGLRLSLGTLAASILFAPLVGLASRMTGEGVMARLPMSWDHRLRMWDYALTRISEAPLIGKGLDSSRNFQESFTTRIGVDVPFISLHPHNIGLQTWMEAGLIGAVLFTLAIVSLYSPLRRLTGGHAWRGAAVSGLIMSVAVASAVTVGAWQFWWWGLIGWSLTLVLLIPTEMTLSSNDIAD